MDGLSRHSEHDWGGGTNISIHKGGCLFCHFFGVFVHGCDLIPHGLEFRRKEVIDFLAFGRLTNCIRAVDF